MISLKARSWRVIPRYMAASNCATKEEPVKVEDRGPVRLIAMNRPRARNAVNPTTARQLCRAFRAFDADSDAHVAVLHGLGGTFCAGYDLKELAEFSSDDAIPAEIQDGQGPMGPSHLVLSKPVVAAVSGYAVAGGLELALLCDMRVVEEDAIMGVFCRRFGVPLTDGGTVRLPALIGLSRALDLILTGRAVDAQEALSYGLANRVVPKGKGLEEAVKLAEEITKFPQQCLLADRASAIKNSLGSSEAISQALAAELKAGLKVVQEESISGARRFSQGAGRHGKL